MNLHAKRIAAVLLLAVLGFIGGYFWNSKHSHSPRPATSGDQSVPYGHMVTILSELQTAAEKEMTAQQAEAYASAIANEFAAHPLPEGDDFQFSGELLLRYLRSLSALENYRQLKIAGGGEDPLNPNSKQPNLEAIENQKKNLRWLRQRTRELREKLEKQNATKSA